MMLVLAFAPQPKHTKAKWRLRRSLQQIWPRTVVDKNMAMLWLQICFPVSNAQIRSFVAIWEIGFWTWTIEYNLPLWSSPHFPRCSCVANKIRVSLENSSCKVCRVAVSLKHAEGIKSWLKPGLSKESCWPALCKMRYRMCWMWFVHHPRHQRGCRYQTRRWWAKTAWKTWIRATQIEAEIWKQNKKTGIIVWNFNHFMTETYLNQHIPTLLCNVLNTHIHVALDVAKRKVNGSCSNLMSTILPPNCFPWKKMNLALNDMYWFIVIVIPKTTQPVPSVLQYV